MALWKGESNLAFGIRGQLRSFVDWYFLQKRDESAVLNGEQVADPDGPDVPLWIEFTAVYGEEKVEVDTAHKVGDEALVSWLFIMHNSNRVSAGAKTQYFSFADGPRPDFVLLFPFCVALLRMIFRFGRVFFRCWFDAGSLWLVGGGISVRAKMCHTTGRR